MVLFILIGLFYSDRPMAPFLLTGKARFDEGVRCPLPSGPHCPAQMPLYLPVPQPGLLAPRPCSGLLVSKGPLPSEPPHNA